MAQMEGKYFSEEQVAKYRRIFNLFDINKNGVLEARELEAVSKVLGYRLPSEDIQNILCMFNLDENGVLTFDQFLEAMPANRENISEAEHRKAEYRRKFQEFDVDGNGFISIDEAFPVLSRQLGFSADKAQILLSQFDMNSDGRLSYEEFVAFYCKVKEKQTAMQQAFTQFDQGGKGYVSLQDAERILGRMSFAPQEIEALVRAHDTNQDGKLQYEEFIHFWNV